MSDIVELVREGMEVRRQGDLALRAVEAPDEHSFVVAGHAAVFNDRTRLFGKVFEEVAPTAFTKTLGECDCRFQKNHDADHIMARYVAGRDNNTLELSVDATGLVDRATLDRRQSVAADLEISLARGDISQQSFMFRIIGEERTDLANDEGVLYTIREVELFDVSPVGFPAYEATDIGLASGPRAGWASLCRRLGFGPAERRALQRALAGDIDDGAIPILRQAASVLGSTAESGMWATVSAQEPVPSTLDAPRDVMNNPEYRLIMAKARRRAGSPS